MFGYITSNGICGGCINKPGLNIFSGIVLKDKSKSIMIISDMKPNVL